METDQAMTKGMTKFWEWLNKNIEFIERSTGISGAVWTGQMLIGYMMEYLDEVAPYKMQDYKTPLNGMNTQERYDWLISKIDSLE
jgi:hypothetical protein